MIRPVVDSDQRSSADIDAQVKALASSGEPLYRVDAQALAAAEPDLILTQDVCHVCAVTPDALQRAVASLPHRPQMLTLGPQSLTDVIHDVERIGAALGAGSRGKDLARSLRNRMAAVHDGAAGRPKPRVACLEWLAPLYVGGHWVPEMVDIAGGIDVLGAPGRPSSQVSIEALRAAAPDVVVLMPCGFSVSRTVAEVTAVCRTDSALSGFLRSRPKTFAVDAGSYFSRPGPRLIDGLELMADICGGRGAANRPVDTILELTGDFRLTGISP